MITCAECGATNEAGAQFCGTCGEFLWDSSSRTRQATDRARPTPPPDQQDQTGDERHPEAARPDPTRPGQPDPTKPYPTRPGQPDPPGPGQPEAPKSARSEPPEPAQPEAPKPVQPGRPRPVQPGPPEPGPVSEEDSARPPDTRVTCPNPACGALNDPGRRFCLRCGTSLVASTVTAERKRTWWQRLLDWLRGRGSRHRSLRDEERRVGAAARRILLIMLAVCVVAVLAVVGPPLARRGVEAVRDRIQDPTPLVPTSVVASSEAPGSGANRLIDGASNRYWAPTGRAVDSWVEGRFNEPVRLLTIVITPGVSPRRQAYLAAGRPRELTVITVDAEGEEESTDIELLDEPGEQHFDVPRPNLVRIRLVVRSTYGPGLIPAVAIGEAEFFGRR